MYGRDLVWFRCIAVIGLAVSLTGCTPQAPPPAQVTPPPLPAAALDVPQGVGDQGDEELRALIERCRAREERITSAVGRFAVEQTQMKMSETGWVADGKPLSMICLWAFDGGMVREDCIVYTPLESSPGSIPQPRASSEGWSGRVGYRWSSANDTPAVYDSLEQLQFGSFVEPSLLLATPASNNIRLSEQLARRPGRVVGEETVNGVICRVVEARGQGINSGLVYRWWIAPSRDHMMLKFLREPASPNTTGARWLMQTGPELRKFTLPDGGVTWIAMEFTDTWCAPRGATAAACKSETECHILSLSLNCAIPRHVFEPGRPTQR